MLTVKDINEVSFGKAGFSGYKPEDVDNFIDEVVESYGQLEAERNDAVQQNAQLSSQVEALNSQVTELKAKNAELQKKLAILAQKIESYREEEDGIKEAILSAQRIAKDSIQEAKDKASIMLEDAEVSAKKILDNARTDAARAARDYAEQVDRKRNELEEMKRQVSAFRVSLLEMYKKHLESINHIPSFRVKDSAPVHEEETVRSEPVSAPAPVVEKKPEPQPEPQPEPDPEPIQEVAPQPEPTPEVKPAPAQPKQVQAVAQSVAPTVTPAAAPRQETRKQPARQQAPKKNPEPVSQGDTGLRQKVDYSKEQLSGLNFEDDDLSQVGIDLKAYTSIPESLQREKESHFSNLEFGDDVDVGTNKRRKR